MEPHTEDHFMVRMLRELTDPERGAVVRQIMAEQSGGLDWGYLTRKMSAEGVSALFFYHLEQYHLQDLLPAGFYDLFSGQYYASLKRNMLTWAALNPVFARLNDLELPFIVLKGLALAEKVYPGFAVRGMSDADILIRKEQVCRVDACLLALGYTPRDSSAEQALGNPPGYLASLDYRKNDGSLPNLHIHWHPVNTSVPAFMFAGCLDMDRLWEKAILTELANAQVRVLCPEHQVIYLCEHALRINHSFDRLILIYDIFYVIKALDFEINWDFIVREAQEFNLSRLVFLSLSIVKHFTSLAISEEIVGRFCPGDLTWGERSFLGLQFKNRRLRGSSILVYLAMNKGFIEKGRFLFRIFFPPRHILLQRQYIKNGEFGVSHYLRRLWEVLSHLIGICRHHPYKP
jgi:hypothetical protein